jgi:catechol 2,3-dioxygenase-like lactoylglutathione lyase family enzyme
MFCKLDHIHLRCQDVEKSVEYYVNLFAGEVVARFEARGMPIVRLKVGETFLALSPRREDEPEVQGEGTRWGAYELGFLVEDLDRACQELRAKGAEFAAGPLEARSGVRVAFLKAPDGMQIEILHRD